MTSTPLRWILGPAAMIVLLVGLLGTPATRAAGDDDDDDDGDMLEVTITNLTRGQILSPAVVWTHSGDYGPLFTLGAPASPELAAVAEDAVNGPLVAALEGDPSVEDIKTAFGVGGPIMPGESASVTLEKDRLVSFVSMLITTNDAVAALNGVRASGYRTRTYRSPAYDAGSEENNEDCTDIPGPPCGDTTRANNGTPEGFVHVHGGIHGIGNANPAGGVVVPAMHDWRNPVAKITIRRRD